MAQNIDGNPNTAALLKRVFMFLEDSEWNRANEYCEKILDTDPECAEAYLCKLMVELRVQKPEKLQDLSEPFEDNSNYLKAIRFASGSLKEELVGYIEHIKDGIYNGAKSTMDAANTEKAYKEAANVFKTIPGHKDSDALVQECYDKAEEIRKDNILAEGKSKMVGEAVSNYAAAIKLFNSIAPFFYSTI